MTGTQRRLQARLLLVASLALLAGCAAGMQLRTESAGQAVIQGTYDLYLYGCRYPDDVENVAILVSDNTPYSFEIHDLRTSYRVRKGLPAEQALREAKEFVRCSTSKVWTTGVRRIEDDRGKVFGYDVRPIYMPAEYPSGDILIVSYALRNGTVSAYVRFSPSFDPDNPFQDDQGSFGGR